MSYEYANEKPKIFTESGVRMLLEIRDKVKRLSKQSGAVRVDKAMTAGDSWTQLACFDYMVERGDIRQVSGVTAGQDRVFVWIGEENA